MNAKLDQKPQRVIVCRKCGSDQVTALRDWTLPPSRKVFDPSHRCNRCGWDFIYRSPREVLRELAREYGQ